MVPVIILTTLTIIVIISVISDEIKFIRFKDRIQIGTQLTTTVRYIGDEFDDGYTFTITILKKGKHQVRVRYGDGSETGMNMYTLYYEGWKILTDNNL